MERRKLQRANQLSYFPDALSGNPYKGYSRIDWINSAAKRMSGEEKLCNLMHHFNRDNLKQAFRKLKGSKASGIDNVTKAQYNSDLDHNIECLEDKIRKGGWRPKPSREVLIPKANGGKRRLAVGCLEDKIAQTLAARILEATFEPVFDYRSYGFRHNKSGHQTIAKIYSEIKYRYKNCVIVDIDIKSFFDSIDHEKLMEYIETRIRDAHFLRLIRRMLRNSILKTGGVLETNTEGTPQGSPISPVLANIYLHFLVDDWFDKNWWEQGEIVRYADDMIFILTDYAQAIKFESALKERLKGEGKIEINEDKSRIVRFSKHKPEGTISFLGFEFYWGRYAGKRKILKVKTNAKALSKSIQAFKKWIKRVRNRMCLDRIWEKSKTKLIGHYNYYGVTFNLRRLNHFYWICTQELFKWLNRRSQKRSFTWDRFKRRLFFKPLVRPKGTRLLDITYSIGSS